jgi:RHS repeat-associated protein
MDYFGARFYDPNLGRWLTPDWSDDPTPVPYADLTSPQTLNLYAYVENNPITGIDPDGHLGGSGFEAGIDPERYWHATQADNPRSIPHPPKQKKKKPQKQQQQQVILGVTSDTRTKAVTLSGAVEQRDINYTAGTLDKDKNFRADHSKKPPTVTLIEKQTGGNDKPITCNPCSEEGTFDDSIHVSGMGKTFTIEQKLEINGKPAIIYKMDASGKLISGTSVRVEATDSAVNVTLVP